MARRSRKLTERDVTRVLRGATAAGIQIQRVEYEPGKITLVMTEAGANSAEVELDAELAAFEAKHGQD